MNCRIVFLAALLPAGDVFAVTHFVATNSAAPAAPYTNWASASHDIQSAIDASAFGDDVLVTDGVYKAGGAVTPDFIMQTNRIVVTNFMRVRSVNGAVVTTIQGQYDTNSGGTGPTAIRCAWLSGGAIVEGFTLAGGAAVDSPNDVHTIAGGGIFNDGATVSNCVIANNKAGYGGGTYTYSPAAFFDHCTFTGNQGGLGGGAMMASGGGTLRNCLVALNLAGAGGGVWDSGGLVESCTIAGNSAGNGGGLYVSGPLARADVVNTIVFGNTASSDTEYTTDTNLFFTFSCTTPLPAGAGNIAANPLFYGPSDFRIRGTSPCIDAGTNETWMAGGLDLDDEPRLRGALPDIGADEAWRISLLALTNAGSSATITWDTVTDRAFVLQSTTNLPGGVWTNAGNVVTSASARLTVVVTNAPGAYQLYRLIYAGP